MERIAILDHNEHKLYVEDIDEDVLNNQYWGEEERYIRDNYDMEHFSWEYIGETLYFPEMDKDPVEVEFTKLI
jgi:hypothetical protein